MPIKKEKKKNEWEEWMLIEIQANTTYPVEREYRFDKTRRWRFDFAIPELMLALEFEGGVWIGGRHTRPLGFVKDCEKYNTATLQGWKVYRLVPQLLNQGWIERIFNNGNTISQ